MKEQHFFLTKLVEQILNLNFQAKLVRFIDQRCGIIFGKTNIITIITECNNQQDE